MVIRFHARKILSFCLAAHARHGGRLMSARGSRSTFMAHLGSTVAYLLWPKAPTTQSDNHIPAIYQHSRSARSPLHFRKVGGRGLDLCYCDLGPPGLTAFATALEREDDENRGRLEELKFPGTDFDGSGAWSADRNLRVLGSFGRRLLS